MTHSRLDELYLDLMKREMSQDILKATVYHKRKIDQSE